MTNEAGLKMLMAALSLGLDCDAEDFTDTIKSFRSSQPELSCKTCQYNYQEWNDEPCLNCTHENTRWKPIEQPEHSEGLYVDGFNDGYRERMSDEPQWIPVTKKAHPDLPIRVQVQMDNGWIITAYYQEGEWLSVPDCGEPLLDNWIEAWRELPEPWKGEEP